LPLLVGACVVAVLIGLAGYAIGAGGTKPVTWVETRTGHFDILSQDLQAGCFTPNSGESECGGVVWLGTPGSAQVGQSVDVEVLSLTEADGTVTGPVFLVGDLEGAR
jgi:hypothetical protein